MAFAIINGVQYAVQTQGAQENEPEYIGQNRRAFAGNPRSSMQGEKNVYQITLAPILDVPDYAALRTAIKNAAQVACSGDFNGRAAGLKYIIRMTGCVYLKPSAVGPVYRVPTLELREV